MDDAAQRGFALFTGHADCASCHSVGARDALFTDLEFHDTGYGWMRERARQNPPATTPVQVAPGIVYDVDFAKVAAVGQGREADLGRYEVTEDPADRWKFRTPSLRNVGVTRPYMHDGALTTLAEVIAFYDAGGAGNPGQDPRIRPLGLSDEESSQLVAFLESLTGDNVDRVVEDAFTVPVGNTGSD